MSSPPSATTSIILDRLDELRDDQRGQHRELTARLERIESVQRDQGGQLVNLCQHQEACVRWNQRHEREHGLSDAKPSPWIANQLAWAWHHPKRTLICAVLMVSLFVPPVRHMIGDRVWDMLKAWW